MTVPVPRPLRPLAKEQLDEMLLYTCRQLWPRRADRAVLADALDQAQADMVGDLFDVAGALLASLARVELVEPVGQRAAWVGAWLFLHVNRRPIPFPFDQDAAYELVVGAAEGRIGALEAGERLRTLWKGEHHA